MSSPKPFTIYDASAGSGKTFALVKAYLKKILVQPQNNYYRHLLAITFTNKAVAEMKERIVRMLVGFSSKEPPPQAQTMLEMIHKEISISPEEIRWRSAAILKDLLHNYAQFSVETIDHFNHRLIRTFARDLNLPGNFEVSLEVQELISKAVDQLISKAGENEQVTALLLEYALQKTDEDKSWDIALDLKKTAAILANENDAQYFEKLKNKSLSSFVSLQKKLQEQTQEIATQMQGYAKEIISLFEQHSLDRSHFDRGYLFDFFQKIASGEFKLNYETSWQQNIGIKPIYPARVKGAEAQILDDLTPKIGNALAQIKERVYFYFLLKNLLKNLVPLATVNLVHQELQVLKEEENVLPISEFNALIHDQIKDQPAPFVYERLGDRYRDFFIDEFQDTSLLQWNNLIPLIDNAISQSYEDGSRGSLLLVGDAKQSIYRWRGGLPEQFMDLHGGSNPFSIDEENIAKIHLEANYRSKKEIVEFNNRFFQFASGYFGNPSHQELYLDGNAQEATAGSGGYVHLEFLDQKDPQEQYSQKVYETIENVLALGYSKKDICVLTRKKKEGIAISEYLLEHEIPVVSEETLLLKNAPAVQCLIYALQLSNTPYNEEIKIQFLDFIHQHLLIAEGRHPFFERHIHSPLDTLTTTLQGLSIDFNFKHLLHLSLFESCEYIIDSLRLNASSNIFLLSFMDVVFNFSQRPDSGKGPFLEYWETEREKASISENKSTDAVRVMTIHKSKGLEFPIVIFPYADLDIYAEISPRSWYPFNEDGFEELLISYNKELAHYNSIGAQMVRERRTQQELDNLNLLYVALTRPEQQLYIFTRDKKVKSKQAPTTYSAFFRAFLEAEGSWNETSLSYHFGSPKKVEPAAVNEIVPKDILHISSPPESHNIRVVTKEMIPESTEVKEAKLLGNILHDTMAFIHTLEDVEPVLHELELRLGANHLQLRPVQELVRNIVNHPELNSLFLPSVKNHNERDIITPQHILRPDRINIHPDQSVTLVDYKTGAPREAYEHQINKYASALSDMGFTIKEKLLVYGNIDGILINKT
ncbi:MAG: UvrD-helicase domain-containing protein [Bacteroidota bacterium]